MDRYYNYCLSIDDLTINCCPCYEDYWKNVKQSNRTTFMDYSIEKNESSRVYVGDEKIFIHFCYVCLKKNLFKKQYLIVSSLEFLSNQQNTLLVAENGCIADVLRGRKKIETVCSGCVIFIIKRSDPSDVIVVN